MVDSNNDNIGVEKELNEKNTEDQPEQKVSFDPEKLKSMETKLNSLQETLAKKEAELDYLKYQIAAKPQEAAEKVDEVDWSDKFQEDPKAAIQELLEEKLNNFQQQQSAKSLSQNLDQEAYKKIPSLSDDSSAVFKATRKKIAEIKKVDPKAEERPDLVYTAALAAVGEMALNGQLNTTNKDEILRQYRVTQGQVEAGSFPSRKAENEITPRRKRIAERLGVKTDIYSKLVH